MPHGPEGDILCEPFLKFFHRFKAIPHPASPFQPLDYPFGFLVLLIRFSDNHIQPVMTDLMEQYSTNFLPANKEG